MNAYLWYTAAELEAAIREALMDREALTIEELVVRMADWSWSEVLYTIDALSRRGDITLKREGSQYLVALPAAPPVRG